MRLSACASSACASLHAPLCMRLISRLTSLIPGATRLDASLLGSLLRRPSQTSGESDKKGARGRTKHQSGRRRPWARPTFCETLRSGEPNHRLAHHAFSVLYGVVCYSTGQQGRQMHDSAYEEAARRCRVRNQEQRRQITQEKEV
jgi:hypothetical protein